MDPGPEPPKPTDEDYTAMSKWSEYEDMQDRNLKRMRPYAFTLTSVGLVVLLYWESRYAFVVFGGCLLASFAICIPFMWVNSNKMNAAIRSFEKVADYADWQERKRELGC